MTENHKKKAINLSPKIYKQKTSSHFTTLLHMSDLNFLSRSIVRVYNITVEVTENLDYIKIRLCTLLKKKKYTDSIV